MKKKALHIFFFILINLVFMCCAAAWMFGGAVAAAEKQSADAESALSLQQVVGLALQHNSNLSSQYNALSGSMLSLESSRSDFDIQLTPVGNLDVSGGSENADRADYYLGATMSREFSTGSRIAVTPGVARKEDGSGSIYQSSVGLRLTQPLFRGISPEYNLSSVNSAEFSVRSARRRYFLAQVDVFLQTVNGFYSILLQKELVETRAQSVQRLESFAQSAKLKRSIGLADPEDEYRAVQRMKQAKDDLVANEQALELAEDNLRQILNWPATRPIHIDGDLTQEPVTVNEAQVIETALNNRVEIVEAEDLLREKYRLSRVARHRLLPELDISIYYTPYGEDSSLRDAVQLKDSRWGLTLSTDSDIFRRKEKAEFQRSLLAIDDAKRYLSNEKDDIVREVRETIRNLHESLSRIELQKERALEAERQLEISRLKFKYGMTNNFDLIDAESVFSSARTNVENAKAQYIIGIYQLRAAMGTLLDFPEEAL